MEIHPKWVYSACKEILYRVQKNSDQQLFVLNQPFLGGNLIVNMTALVLVWKKLEGTLHPSKALEKNILLKF